MTLFLLSSHNLLKFHRQKAGGATSSSEEGTGRPSLITKIEGVVKNVVGCETGPSGPGGTVPAPINEGDVGNRGSEVEAHEEPNKDGGGFDGWW